MDGIAETIIKILTEGGKDAVMSLGWLLYLMERYVVSVRREKEFRADVNSFRTDYQQLAEKLSVTLNSFSTILEIIKDRIGRPPQ